MELLNKRLSKLEILAGLGASIGLYTGYAGQVLESSAGQEAGYAILLGSLVLSAGDMIIDKYIPSSNQNEYGGEK